LPGSAGRKGGCPAKVVETIRIVRYAMATKVIGDAEAVFDVLNKTENDRF